MPVCEGTRFFEWNGVTDLPEGFAPVLIRSDGGSEDEPVLELFDATGAAVSPPRTVYDDAQCPTGCPLQTTSYDLSALPSGDYTVVLRRDHLPGEMIIGYRGADGIPWGSWEGEDALVSTLRIP